MASPVSRLTAVALSPVSRLPFHRRITAVAFALSPVFRLPFPRRSGIVGHCGDPGQRGSQIARRENRLFQRAAALQIDLIRVMG